MQGHARTEIQPFLCFFDIVGQHIAPPYPRRIRTQRPCVDEACQLLHHGRDIAIRVRFGAGQVENLVSNIGADAGLHDSFGQITHVDEL